MDVRWFYVDGGQRRGPVALEDLVGTLLAMPDPHRVRVWREGLADWQEAASVPEIRGRLPPAGPLFQPLEDAEAMAQLYRRLVLLVGLQILFAFAVQALAAAAPSLAEVLISLVSLLVSIGLLVAIIITAYRLAGHLGEGLPVLWAIAMFVPCLNIIALLALSSRAQAWCRRYGIKVGFLGPTKESLEEFRQRILTSNFE